MKKITYKILTHIPIVGAIVKVIVDPIELYGSNIRSDGDTDDLYKKINEYCKEHPDVQFTRQVFYKICEDIGRDRQ